jgi:outer membrane cobalamin receptor
MKQLLLAVCVFSFLFPLGFHLWSGAEYFDMRLEDLMHIKTRVASIFPESDLLVGGSVSTISESEWRMQGARSLLQDPLAQLPGVVTYPTLAGGRNIAIRGYARNASGGGFSMLFDGVPMNSLTFASVYVRSNINLEVLKGMEIIRGPGSSIYGSDAFHGVVSLNSYDPKLDETEILSTLGDHRYQNLSVRTSHAIGGKHRFSSVLAVNGQGDQQQNYASRLFPGRVLQRAQEFEAGSGLFKWKFNPKEDFSWDLTLFFHQWEADEVPGANSLLKLAQLQPEDNAMEGAGRFGLGRAKFRWNLGDGEDIEVLTYRWTNNLEFQGIGVVGALAQGDRNLRSGVNITWKRPRRKSRTRWVVGAGFDRQEIQTSFTNVPPFGVAFDGSFRKEAFDGFAREVKSFFVQTKTQLKDQWHLLLGGRLDHYPVFGVQTTPRAGVIYQSDSQTAWKLLYGNAFRAPTASESTSTLGGRIRGGAHLRPEEIDLYELIYLRHWRDRRLKLTLFDSSWENAISIGPDALGLPVYKQSGSNEAQGVEFEWSSELNQDFRLDINSSYIDARDNQTMQRFVAFPRKILSLGCHYNPPGRSLSAQLWVRLMDGWHDGPGLTSLPLSTYVRTDLTLRKRLEDNQELYLSVRNLLDRELRVPSIWDAESGVPEQGIRFSLGLKMKF